MNPFAKLGISGKPVFLAPLAGVSDHPFRRSCAALGADLTYVEMISATALLLDSRRTLAMMVRHPSERILGIQITGRSAEETARAVAKLHPLNYETIDINMGCPVRKVVQNGCGSAILKDPERVFQTVKLCRTETDKPFSVKIRIGWDRDSLNAVEVAQAAAAGGADWITVHGRTRSDDYSVAVDLPEIRKVKAAVGIPVLGNGNIFCANDAEPFYRQTGCDGLMVSRGGLGNPWLFRDLKAGQAAPVKVSEWWQAVKNHLNWQQEAYGDRGNGAVCMRKHLLWYIKGWPGSRKLREEVNHTESLAAATTVIAAFVASLEANLERQLPFESDGQQRFTWDPKWEMDRQLDRGVGADGLVVEQHI